MLELQAHFEETLLASEIGCVISFSEEILTIIIIIMK